MQIGKLDPRRYFKVLHLPRDGWDAVHHAATGVLLWWSFIFALPGSTYATGQAFDVMRAIASEHVWAVVFFAFALVGWWGIETRSGEVRRVSCLMLSIGHSLIAWSVFTSAPLGTGSGTYAIIAILALGRMVADADSPRIP